MSASALIWQKASLFVLMVYVAAISYIVKKMSAYGLPAVRMHSSNKKRSFLSEWFTLSQFPME